MQEPVGIGLPPPGTEAESRSRAIMCQGESCAATDSKIYSARSDPVLDSADPWLSQGAGFLARISSWHKQNGRLLA